MSSESDLLFAQPDTLLLSDFNHLTEFEDFPKYLFLSNAMEGIAGGSLLEELDCKDALKPLLISAEVNNAFSASLRDDDDKRDVHSSKAHDSPFTVFMDDEPSGSLGFMTMASKLELPIPDVLSIKTMGLTSLVGHTLPSGCSGQGDLPSPRTKLPTNQMDYMSLDELGTSQLDSSDALSALSLSLEHAGNLVTQGNAAEPVPTLPPLSPLGKVPMARSLFSSATQVSCSTDTITPSVLQINSPVMSPSMTTTISTSDGGSLLNMKLGRKEKSNIHTLAGTVRQSVTDLSAFPEYSSLSNIQCPKSDGFVSCHDARPPHAMQESSHNPTLQRSHSSHALGQLRTSSHLGPCTNEFSMSPPSKMELLLSSTSNVRSFAQYQAFNTQGSAAGSSIAPMRRVYSTGDLKVFNRMQNIHEGNLENAKTEEAAGLKIGHCTVEERKMKLHRYRQKRTERNFSKKIKYACRKTLADSRLRIRGRFARNYEIEEPILKSSDLPFIGKYEDISRHSHLIPEAAYLTANNSCIMANKPAAQFWSAVGMKVAM